MTPSKTETLIPTTATSLLTGMGEKKNLYTLYFRRGSNPHPQVKNFFMNGTMQEVVARAKKHCEVLGCRFVRIEPFISDLAIDERQHTGGSANDEN